MTTFDVKKGDRVRVVRTEDEYQVVGDAKANGVGQIYVPVRASGDRYDTWFRLSGDAPALIRHGLEVYRNSFLAHAATSAPDKVCKSKTVDTSSQGALL